MYRSKKRIFLLWTALLLALYPLAAFPEDKPVYTLLVYMIGSDLETNNGLASADIAQMQACCPGEVQIYLCLGGAKVWRNGMGEEGTSVYRIHGGITEKVLQMETSAISDAATLSAFLGFARQDTGDSGRTALVFWNHGGGPLLGFGLDENSGGNRLSLDELSHALASSPYQGEHKLEWIGIDACLMGSLEVTALMQPYAKYLIASEEVEMACGWDYSFLQMLPSMPTPEAVAERILEDYYLTTVNSCGGVPNLMPAITMACYDLSMLPDVMDKLDVLARKMESSLLLGSFLSFAALRTDVRQIGKFTGGIVTDLVDLGQLSQCMGEFFPAEAQAFNLALQKLVVNLRTNSEALSGISIYFPYNDSAAYLTMGQYMYEGIPFPASYQAFINLFAIQWMSGRTSATEPLHGIPGECPMILLPNELAETYQSGSYVLLADYGADGYCAFYRSNEVALEAGVLSAKNYEESVFLYNDMTGECMPISLYPTEEDEANAYFDGPCLMEAIDDQYIYSDFNINLQIAVSRDTRICTVLGAYRQSYSVNGFGKQQVVFRDLADYSLIFSIQGKGYTADTDGQVLCYDDWPFTGASISATINKNEMFHLSYEPITRLDRDIYCQFIVRDMYGNQYASALLPVSTGQGAEYEKAI